MPQMEEPLLRYILGQSNEPNDLVYFGIITVSHYNSSQVNSA